MTFCPPDPAACTHSSSFVVDSEKCRHLLAPTDPNYRPLAPPRPPKPAPTPPPPPPPPPINEPPPQQQQQEDVDQRRRRNRLPSSLSDFSARYDRDESSRSSRAAMGGGPLSSLRAMLRDKCRVRVVLRRLRGLRGYCTGVLVAFDRHWNMVRFNCDACQCLFMFSGPHCSMQRLAESCRLGHIRVHSIASIIAHSSLSLGFL